MQNTLVEYIRKGHGRKKGLLLAGAMDGKIYIGYSLCSNTDKFSTITARNIALNRAVVLDSGRGVEKVPDTVRVAVRAFAKRCAKYYKNMPLPMWLETVEMLRAAAVMDEQFDDILDENVNIRAKMGITHG